METERVPSGLQLPIVSPVNWTVGQSPGGGSSHVSRPEKLAWQLGSVAQVAVTLMLPPQPQAIGTVTLQLPAESLSAVAVTGPPPQSTMTLTLKAEAGSKMIGAQSPESVPVTTTEVVVGLPIPVTDVMLIEQAMARPA
jgi:hypothetical protein